MEFSFKKLLKVGGSAIVTAAVKFIGVFLIGFVTAQALSWSFMESVFLGGLLSMSSTMVVLKSYEDLGLKNKPYAGVVFGTLVVEDLIAILLMVLLSTMAVSQSFAGKELIMNIAKLVFFLILWFLVGIYVIPTLLKKAKEYLNDEILLIVSIGLCFGMVALATSVGFSSALGAFVMGSILAETSESEHIDHIVEPIKNLFGAIFFVSVGMMVAPSVIAEHWAMILLLSVIVIISHIIFAGAGIILTGNGLDNAVHTGFSLAQLGEFGFIIAGVGCTLGVMRDFIYPVIIAVSVITTFTTPFMIKLADPCYDLLNKRLPAKWIDRLGQMNDSGKQTAAEHNEWKTLLNAYFTRIVLYGVILIAIYIGSKLYLRPAVEKFFPELSVTIHKVIDYDVHTETLTISQNSTYAGKALKDIPFRAKTGANIIKIARGSMNMIVPSGDVVLFPGDQMLAIGTSAQLESLRNMMASAVAPETQDSVSRFKIEPEILTEDSFLTGKTLRGTNLRKYHCMVISVLRDSKFITNPEPDFRFQVGDTVWIAGNISELETV